MARKASGPRREDGLAGRTAAERCEIRVRIARVSAYKATVDGRELTPLEIAWALGADRLAPAKRCPSCGSRLPRTREYFSTKGPGRMDYICRACRNRRQLGRKRPTMDAAARERHRARDRDYRARRAADVRSGKVERPEPTPRSKLVNARRVARQRLARCADPRRAEVIRARIADMTHEIERLTRRESA